MKLYFNKLVIGIVLYVLVCLLANLMMKPFSLINFIGPAAGFAGALAIVWGRAGLLSALLGNICFHLIQFYYFEYTPDVAAILLSSLAIFLQAYWVMQLTAQSIKKQAWLNNRVSLFKFILCIGPLVGLVGALTVLLITAIDVKQLYNPPLYVFVTSYSGSILVSVFAIPAFLFTYGRDNLALSKRVFLILSSILGIFAVGFLFYVSQHQHQYQREHHFNRTYQNIELAMKNELSNINEQLDAMSALYKSSENVSLREFRSFAHHIYKEKSSVALLQWVPAVELNNKKAFENDSEKQLKIDYKITEFTLLGDIILSDEHDVYLPVKYIYPVNQYEQIYGLNLWQDDLQKKAISRSVNLRKTVASETFTLNFLRQREEAMLMYKPLFNVRNNYGSLRLAKQSPVSGFIVALVKIEPFLAALMAQYPEVNLHIEDVSHNNGLLIYGKPIDVKNRLQKELHVDVYSRNWKVSIVEKSPWSIQNKSWQVWGMIIGATVGGIFFQLLFLLMAVYSIELNHRVTLKTRDLILAKDQAEKESSAKTQFLHTLSNELRTPFNVIKRLTETFPEESPSPKIQSYIANISDASLNLEQLIDTVNELSNIESGLVHLNPRPFDFSVFLSRMQSMIKVNSHLQDHEIKITLAKDLPTFINTDELRLQKLFMMLLENVEEILSSRAYCVSVNVHFHKRNNATLFFVVTHLDEEVNSVSLSHAEVMKEETNFSLLNTGMAIIQELCVLFGGDLSLSPLPSGNLMISASVKINLHQLKHENPIYESVELEPDIHKLLAQKRVLLIQESNNHDEHLCQNLLKVDYHVEVIAEDDDILSYLENSTYHIVIFDCTYFSDNIIKMIRHIRQLLEYKNLPLIGLVPADITHDKVIVIQGYLTEYTLKPISEERLRLLLGKY